MGDKMIAPTEWFIDWNSYKATMFSSYLTDKMTNKDGLKHPKKLRA
jgi:hypothetical protein